jgi:RND family efflux transporter MFP subunit
MNKSRQFQSRQEPSPVPAHGTALNWEREKQPTVILTNPRLKQDTVVKPLSPPAPEKVSHSSQPPGRKKKHPVITGLILGLLVLLGGTGFAVLRFALFSIPGVTAYQVGVQNVSLPIGGGGIVFPRQQLTISYPVAERVISVLVNAGDQVSPNQPLIQLDPSQLNVQIQQAAADVAAAQAYLNSASVSGTALNIAQAQQQYNLAKNRYNALVAEAASPLLHNGNLISPMKGVITSLNVNPGEVFAADTPLLTIMDESTVIVHAKIPLTDLGQVQLGRQAIVMPSALPGLHLQGTVSSIILQADPQTDTFEVWVEVLNTSKVLLPGMSTFVSIQRPARVLVVPRLSVLDLDSDPFVFVVQDQRVYLRHVQVVGRSVDEVFIGGGLSAGDKVVLVGLDGLQDGQQVRVTRIEV